MKKEWQILPTQQRNEEVNHVIFSIHWEQILHDWQRLVETWKWKNADEQYLNEFHHQMAVQELHYHSWFQWIRIEWMENTRYIKRLKLILYEERERRDTSENAFLQAFILTSLVDPTRTMFDMLRENSCMAYKKEIK